MSYINVLNRNSPIALWTFDTLSGATAPDRSGGGRDGTLVGSVTTQQSGVQGYKATLFAPENRYTVPHNAVFNTTTAITIEAWVKFTTTANRQIACKTEDSFFLRVTGGTFAVFFNSVSADWLYSAQTHNDGKWHHVAATWSQASGVISLYVDGVLSNSVARGGTITSGTAIINIAFRAGEAAGSRGLDGSLAFLVWYSTALTADQVAVNARPYLWADTNALVMG